MIHTCCGYFTLQTGAVISGVLGILEGVVTLVTLFLEEENVHNQSDDKEATSLIHIIYTAVSVLLIFGAAKRNRQWVMPWLVGGVIVLGLTILTGVVITVGMVRAGRFGKEYMSLIMYSVMTGIFAYLLIVVYSFYLELKAEASSLPQPEQPQEMTNNSS